MHNIRPLINSLHNFAKERLKFTRPPKLFLKQDLKNSEQVLGRTAYYDPQEESITVFTSSRHPKDILRSFAHELVHHAQNLRGDLSPEKCGEMSLGYAQENPHMREMEREAYEQGNLCFRDWEDNYKSQANTDQINITLKENKDMNIKISKKELKNLIEKVLSKKRAKLMEEKEEGCEECKKCGKLHEGECETEEIVEEEAPVVADNSEDLEDLEDLEEVETLEEQYNDCGCTDLDGTPERENNLYKERFGNRNDKIFESLLRKWTGQ